MDRNVLMIGFHFPPSAESSGHLRLLGFARHLPACGWNPIVLSASTRAYNYVDPSSVSDIPPSTDVHRAYALDSGRDLAFRGRYPYWLALPDRWVSWWPAAFVCGLNLVRRRRVRAIWSTFPIMTAHCVAYALHRVTGIPWVADFRDPVDVAVNGKNAAMVRSQMRWERRVLSRATRAVVTTPSAAAGYATRYPEARSRISMIPNGFEEQDFEGWLSDDLHNGRSTLQFVHAGILYPDGRNPAALFEALAGLRSDGTLGDDDLHVTLRASGAEATYAGEIQRLGLGRMVSLAPSIPHRDALAELEQADALLLFQGAQYDRQIPAKLYEYLRIGRPILALVGEHGDTSALLQDVPNAVMAPLDDVAAIRARLPTFIERVRAGTPRTPPRDLVERYSRRHAARQLAEVLDEVSGTGAERGR